MLQKHVHSPRLISGGFPDSYIAYIATGSVLYSTLLGLARTIYKWSIYGTFGREITKYTVIYSAYISSWPTLHILLGCWHISTTPLREHASSTLPSVPYQIPNTKAVPYQIPDTNYQLPNCREKKKKDKEDAKRRVIEEAEAKV